MPLRVNEPVELADCGEPARDRARRELAPGQHPPIGPHVLAAGARDRTAVRGKVRGKIREIRRIGLQRVFRGAPLGREHVEE